MKCFVGRSSPGGSKGAQEGHRDDWKLSGPRLRGPSSRPIALVTYQGCIWFLEAEVVLMFKIFLFFQEELPFIGGVIHSQLDREVRDPEV
jgi:hypothetical protein